MKIGIDISVLNDRQKKGIATYTYQLINALLKINREDRFILFGIAAFSAFDYLKNLPFKNYSNVELKIFKMPKKAFRMAFLLWQKINFPSIEYFIGKVDIFHSFNWYFPPQKSGKKIGTIFDLTPLTFPELHDKRTRQLDKVRIKRISEVADMVVTISQNSKKDFLKISKHSRVEVIYPASSESFSTKVSKLEEARVMQKYNLEPGYYLFVGTIEPRKNLLKLIKAYLSLSTGRPLVIVGGLGWKNLEVLKLIKRNHQKIKMLGFVPDDDLPILYKCALCLVYPSLYEGFGLPVLEALSSATPVICSDTSSMSEVGGQAVFYIDPENINNIAYGMKVLERDAILRKKLIEKGLKQAQKFSWEKSAKKLNFLYQSFKNLPKT